LRPLALIEVSRLSASERDHLLAAAVPRLWSSGQLLRLRIPSSDGSTARRAGVDQSPKELAAGYVHGFPASRHIGAEGRILEKIWRWQGCGS